MKQADLDINPELVDKLAELLAEGCSHRQIAEVFDVNQRTISDWRRRGDVQAVMAKKITERASRILRHTDSRVEKHLEQNPKISLDQLLRIRREFAGSTVTVKESVDKSGALTELMQQLHENPDLAAAFGEKPPDAD